MKRYFITDAKYFEDENDWVGGEHATVRFIDDSGKERWITLSYICGFAEFSLSEDNPQKIMTELSYENIGKIISYRIDEFNGISLKNRVGGPVDLFYFKDNDAYSLLNVLFTLLENRGNEEFIHSVIGKDAKDIDIETSMLMVD
ncbi:hypothetical protein [Pseudobutyrivibrio xylanivorans]|uniref:Uncharacterized protein n=1 Tax=Pseudobutyrivibrio xylanivorans TaxID=185007 RepID=A0A5P6VM25_PSEXY|nr:hypothetical protein [Pseudobutyrivibrio xylanivorans]QFJ53383.1 hypothetical protein FXF36_00095 [Pseudobutyrivibrio xylanivorans]QFJ53460.1 hypothetical protein FXF36_00505 [Pseudobutyrivibrio xylanivorans]